MKPDEIIEKSTWDLFWLPSGVNVVDRPEILFIYDTRKTRNLNAVFRTRAADEDLPRLIAEVAERHQNVESRWIVTPASYSPALEKLLEKAGYSKAYIHYGYVKSTEQSNLRENPNFYVKKVETVADMKAFYGLFEKNFKRPFEKTEKDMEADLALSSPEVDRAVRFMVYCSRTNLPVSSAGIFKHPKLRFGFLFGGNTLPEYRGRGAYSLLLEERIKEARLSGLDLVGLNARIDSSAPIVEKRGFTRCGITAFWEKLP